MADESSRPIPDLSGIMSMISENPALMEMASNIMSGLPKSPPAPESEAAPSAEGSGAPSSVESPFGPPPSFDPELLAKLMPMLGGGELAKRSPSDERRCALLRAIRPYLSPERRDAIDYMLKFSKLTDLMRAFERPQ